MVPHDFQRRPNRSVEPLNCCPHRRWHSASSGCRRACHRLWTPARVALVALMSAVFVSTCAVSPSSSATVVSIRTVHGDTVPVVAHLGAKTFTVRGPFATGVRTLTLSGDGAPVEIWYPAYRTAVKGSRVTYNVESWLPPALQKLFPPNFKAATYSTDAYRGLPVAAGRFPLVVFTHGYAGFRDQSTFLTTRLASWGCVVAAPDLLDNDLTAVLSGRQSTSDAANVTEIEDTISLMAAENGAPSSPFRRHLDMDRVAAIGHSLGGAASDGAGYLLAAADGGVYAFGDAAFEGSLPGLGVHVADVVAIRPTPDGAGYWLVGSDGGIFAFGDAPYPASLPGLGVHVSNVVGVTGGTAQVGALLVASDGGTFALGKATFAGSLPGLGVSVHNVVAGSST
jgi:Platelet-activating factor acetylhydrolase, isoform II